MRGGSRCPVTSRGAGRDIYLSESLLSAVGDPGAGVTLSKCEEAGMNLEHGLGDLGGRVMELSRPKFRILQEFSRSFSQRRFICSTNVYWALTQFRVRLIQKTKIHAFTELTFYLGESADWQNK